MTDAITQSLERSVQSGSVPLAIGVVANRDSILYDGAAGVRSPGSDEPVTSRSIMRMASMTKIVTTVAALHAADEGLIDLAAPVASYCPEFDKLQVLEGFDGDTPRYRPPATQATVHQLITHTSGLGYDVWDPDLFRWSDITGTPSILERKRAVFATPLTSDPGTRWEYSLSTDWLGLVLEATCGKELDAIVRDRVTAPLGMSDTGFAVGELDQSRLVSTHVKSDGAWAATPLATHPDAEFISGGGGLWSTPADYARFERMLLRGGELDGTRILPEAVIDQAFSNQIGDLDVPAEIPSYNTAASAPFNFGPGHKWGYGLLLNTTSRPGHRRAWSGCWWGLINTHYWIDRDSGIAAAFYSQQLPFYSPEYVAALDDFEQAVYQTYP